MKQNSNILVHCFYHCMISAFISISYLFVSFFAYLTSFGCIRDIESLCCLLIDIFTPINTLDFSEDAVFWKMVEILNISFKLCNVELEILG